MSKITLPELLAFVQKKYPQAQIQKETGQVVILTKVTITPSTLTPEMRQAGLKPNMPMDVPIFVRHVPAPYEQNEMIQVVAFVPFAPQEAYFNDLARYLHLLNREIDMPGFGFDEIGKHIFYRSVIPLMGDCNRALEIAMRTIEVLLAFAPELFPSIVALAGGFSRYSELLAKIKKVQPPPPA